MVERARRKAEAAGFDIAATTADAAAPRLPARSTDVVLVRHLAWTLPEPEVAIDRWASLLRPGGRLVMVEGRWGPSARDFDRAELEVDHEVDQGDYATVHRDLPWYGGVPSETLVPVLEQRFTRVEHHDLSGEDVLWGRAVSDERYAVVAHRD